MLLQAKKNKFYHFCPNTFRDHPLNEKENALECFGFTFVFPTISGFRLSYVNSVGGQLCSHLQRTLGLFTTSVQGKNHSESNQFVWQPEVVFKLMQRHPWRVPNLLFGLGFFFIYCYCSSSYLALLNQYNELLVDGLLSQLSPRIIVWWLASPVL